MVANKEEKRWKTRLADTYHVYIERKQVPVLHNFFYYIYYFSFISFCCCCMYELSSLLPFCLSSCQFITAAAAAVVFIIYRKKERNTISAYSDYLWFRFYFISREKDTLFAKNKTLAYTSKSLFSYSLAFLTHLVYRFQYCHWLIFKNGSIIQN